MRIQRKNLYTILTAISKLHESNSVKTSYALAKNKRLILKIIEPLEEVKKPSESYLQYEGYRIDLCAEYCSKNALGEPIIVNGNYAFTVENRHEFDTKFANLRSQFDATLVAVKEKNEQFAALLEEQEDVDFHFLSLVELEKAFPSIPQSIVEALYDIIKEGE